MEFLQLVVALLIVAVTAYYVVIVKGRENKETSVQEKPEEIEPSAPAPSKKKSKPKQKKTGSKQTNKGAHKPSSHARFKRKFGGHGNGNILAMALSPNGEWIATSGDDAQLRITRVEKDSNLFFRANVSDSHDRVTCLSWEADSRTIVCAFRDSCDVAFFRMRKKQDAADSGSKFPYELVELVKRRFTTSSKLDRIAACVADQAHSSPSLVLTSGTKGPSCHAVAWDGKGGNAVGASTKITGERIRLSSDGNFLCGRGEGNSREVKVYELHRKRVKDEPEPVFDKTTQKCLISSTDKVQDISFCGKVCDRAVVCCVNGEVQVWNLDTSGQIFKPMCVTDLPKAPTYMAVSDDGARVAIATDDASLHLLTYSSTPEPTISLDFTIEHAHTVGIGDIQFCPSGSVLFTRGLASKEAFAWNVD